MSGKERLVSDFYTLSGSNADLTDSVDMGKHMQVRQSAELPHWLMGILSKCLNVGESRYPIIPSLLYFLTLLSAICYFVFHSWFIVFDIKSNFTNTEVLEGTMEIFLALIWCSLSIYAHKISAVLFKYRNFRESVRMHSKKIFRVNSAFLISFCAIIGLACRGYIHRMFIQSNQNCIKVQAYEIICPVFFVSELIIGLMGVFWNLMVGAVLLSVSRTHTIAIRRFIGELSTDGKLVETLVNEELSAEKGSKVKDHYYFDKYFGWDEEYSPSISFLQTQTKPVVPVPEVESRAETSSSVAMSSSTGDSSPPPPNREMIEIVESISVTDRKSNPNPTQANTIADPQPMSSEEMTFYYWKINKRFQETSSCMQRWLSSWICFILVYCGFLLGHWFNKTLSLEDFISFIIPIIVLLILCSGYGEVNAEASNVVLHIYPLPDRSHVLSLFTQRPLQLRLYGFALTYNAILGVIGALAITIISRTVVSEATNK